MKFIDVLKEHVPHNKEMIDKLDNEYHNCLTSLGQCVRNNSIKHFADLPELYDLFEFIKNNGFLVEYEPHVNRDFPISVSPIYEEDLRPSPDMNPPQY